MDNCNTFEELIDRAATDELNGTDRWRLEAHLTGCAACRDQLAETRWIARLVRQEFVGVEQSAAIISPHRPRQALARPALALAAAASLLLGAGWWMSNTVWRPKQVANHEPASHPTKGRSFAERKTTLGDPRIDTTDSPAAAADAASDLAALTAAIDREASAAELAASAEVLADVPGDYAAESWRLLARTFPDTKAGRAAAIRMEGSNQ